MIKIICAIITFLSPAMMNASDDDIKKWEWMVVRKIINDTTPFDNNDIKRKEYIKLYISELSQAYETTIKGHDIGWPGVPLAIEGDIYLAVWENQYIFGKHIRRVIDDVIKWKLAESSGVDILDFQLLSHGEKAIISAHKNVHELIANDVNFRLTSR